MKHTPALRHSLLALSLGLAALPVLADDDCDAPLAHWQSREAVRQMAAQQGWQIQRLADVNVGAGLAAAEAQAAQASANYKRFAELKSQGFISAAELERHETMNKSAQASLRQAQAQAGVQTNQTSYAALTADA